MLVSNTNKYYRQQNTSPAKRENDELLKKVEFAIT
jgi:hypothetical protein